MSIINGAEDLMRTELVSPRGSKQKGTGAETGPWRFTRYPHYLSCLRTKRHWLCYSSEVGPGSVVQCQLELENSSPCGRMFPKLIKRRIGKSPVVPLSPIIETWEEVGKVGQRSEGTLKYLNSETMSFPMFWFLQLQQKPGTLCFLFWSLHLLQVKIKSFGTLGFTAQECRFAR